MIDRHRILLGLVAVLLFCNVFYVQFGVGNNSNSYDVGDSVSYHVDVNLTISHINSQPLKYILNPVILNYQDYDIIPYQETSAFEPVLIGSYQQCSTKTDQFSNGFYHIETTLNEGESFSFSHSYDITLNFLKLDLDRISTTEISNQEEIYELYCSPNDTHYLGSHPELVSAAQNIVDNESDPISIAHKLQKWISTHIKYGRRERKYPDPVFGALATYRERQGVCWDMAELMVTFLRIYNIPARMIIGVTLDDLAPTTGEKFVFYEYWENDTITGQKDVPYHAWVEYYAPSIGWLACDPTWSDMGTDYFNTLDTIHFRIAGGSWFSLPRYPYYEASHIKFNPFSFRLLYFYNYSFVMTILVTDSPYINLPISTTVLIIGITAISVFGLSMIIKPRVGLKKSLITAKILNK